MALLAVLALGLAASGTAAADVGEEAEPAPMSIQFPQRHASLVGARALVMVECGGVAAPTCEGTLVLKGLGGAHKVPYAIVSGGRQYLAVPLGEEVDRGCQARVVARTLQLTGGSVRTSSLLRLR
ncbi:MAG TPA: hypothetical protein VFS64_10180 [Solirubrobacterales bacterium]|nr:hypothetical protein [Solirubrobacterales bacterium]